MVCAEFGGGEGGSGTLSREEGRVDDDTVVAREGGGGEGGKGYTQAGMDPC